MEIQPQPQIFDVDEQNFEELVLQGSQERVIVVDFWAPWCGPCKTLGPILEDVVAALGPGVALAKVNVDENQRLAMAFRVQGIPAVKIVKNGQLAQEFTGALPREQIEAILRPLVSDALIPEAQEIDQADDLAATSDLDAAARQYEQMLEENPTDGPALLGLAKIHLQQGRFETVQELVNLVESDAPRVPAGPSAPHPDRVCPPVPAGWGPCRLRPARAQPARRPRGPPLTRLLRSLRGRLRNRGCRNGYTSRGKNRTATKPPRTPWSPSSTYSAATIRWWPTTSANSTKPCTERAMQITRLERTVCCVPFFPGILPPPEYDEPNPSYPEPLSARRQDVLRIHTDQGLTGLGMSGPYYGDRAEQPPRSDRQRPQHL